MLNLANSFAAQGLAVDFVLASATGELLKQVSPAVRLVDLRSSRGVFRALPALAGYLRRVQPTILFTALDYVNVLSLLVWRLCRVKTRVYVSSHNSLLDSASNSPWLRDRWFLTLAVRLTYPWADGIIAVSRGLASLIAAVTKLPPHRVTAIHNPVVDSIFDDRAAVLCDHPWLQNGSCPVVLAVGELEYPKDFETLIEAFALVRQTEQVRLVVLGDGEHRGRLQAKIDRLGLHDDVDLHGFVSNPLPYFRAANVFVLSSKYEGFGLVVVEALACGTPVVATDCRYGPAEILANGKFGRLVPTADSALLSKAIIETLKEEPNPERLRQRGREFSLQRATDAYLRLFGFSPEKRGLNPT